MRSYHVNTQHLGTNVMSRNRVDHDCASNGDNACQHAGETTTVVPSTCDPGPEECREGECDISRHVEERGLLLRESEVVDDDTAKGLEAPVGDVDGDVEAE